MSRKIDLSFDVLRGAYEGGAQPHDVVLECRRRIARESDLNAWIYVESEDALAHRCDELEQRRRRGDDLPLYGIPFGVKDNIDVARMPTTAACPDFTYLPAKSARAVELLVQKGAICVGKTNLDQFATGLSGTRSPYGVCASVQNPDYISGGSSSGSAVAIAASHVAFTLGTDTGGSGRIPAGFNAVVGIKPTLGKVSLRGVVPNCSTLDCVSVFSINVTDGSEILDAMAEFDPADPYSRRMPTDVPGLRDGPFKFGRLAARDLEFFGMDECRKLYELGCERLVAMGGETVEIDFAPFREAGRLLFQGPWIAERKSGLRNFVAANPNALLDVTRRVLDVADHFSAVDAFDGIHLLARLRRDAELTFESISLMVVPTAPRPFRIKDMLANPVELNSQVGYYSHYAHLLDLCAVAVPNATLPMGVPMGLTLLAPAWRDSAVAQLAQRFERQTHSETVGMLRVG